MEFLFRNAMHIYKMIFSMHPRCKLFKHCIINVLSVLIEVLLKPSNMLIMNV